MFSRRKGRCCITATRRSSNAPLNPPVVSFAASSNNSPVSPATYPRIPPRKQKKLQPNQDHVIQPCVWIITVIQNESARRSAQPSPEPHHRLPGVARLST